MKLEPHLATRVLLGALGAAVIALVIAVAANLQRLVPYAVVWGDLGTWAQAVFTGGGLLFAGLSVLLASRQLSRSAQQEEDRLSEARDVARKGLVLRSEWIVKDHMPLRGGRVTYSYEIANMSPFAISDCKISVHMWDERNAGLYEKEPLMDSDDFYQAVVIGMLVPGEVARGKVIVRNPRSALGLWGNDRVANPDMTYTDAWGNHWLRAGTTHFRQFSPDTPEESPQCMCCGTLADEREYLGRA